MKKLSYIVDVEFEDELPNNSDIMEVATNIATAIKNEAEGYGLAPANSDTFTTKVTVSSPVGHKELVSLDINKV